VFPKFLPKVHVLPAEAIPEHGTNYFFMDPAGDRNCFLTWARITPEGAYIYREWPGNYAIPDVGIPGPWSVPSGKKDGLNDGARGEGQQSFGFGLLRYKFEIARLERWHDWIRWAKDRDPDDYPEEDELMEWDARNGAEEVIETRVVDSRAASTPRIERDRPVTLYEELQDAGLDFELAPGAEIRDGLMLINNALDYDANKDGSFFNRPKLMISDACQNTIYSLGNYRNVDGDDGACKDPVDNLRYLYTAQCEYVPGSQARGRRGFYYGQGVTSCEDGGARDEGRGRRRPACMDRVSGVRRVSYRGR
jgi:hypothetical protein